MISDQWANGPSDLHILLLSVTSGPKTREIARTMMQHPLEWSDRMTRDWPPVDLKIAGMYDVIGNWDVVLFIRSHMAKREELIRRFRREILLRAHSEPFPPVHASGGQFGRFEGIAVVEELGGLDGAADVRRSTGETEVDYEEAGRARAFVVIDASPNDERAGPSAEMRVILDAMHQATREHIDPDFIEGVYIGRHHAVIEVVSKLQGGVDLTKFNRLVEPSLAEHAIQKYSLVCYAYEEHDVGWTASE